LKNLYSFFILLSSLQSFAQDQGAIATDRPDQTESPFLVPKGMWQIEIGTAFESIVNSKENFIWVSPTVLWKYGVNKNFELRLITESLQLKTNAVKDRFSTPTIIGFKVKFNEAQGFWPETALIGHLYWDKTETNKRIASPSFRFLMQHNLSEKTAISYNLGAEWVLGSLQPLYIYTLSNSWSLSKKWGGFYELYGFTNSNFKEHNFDAGLTYLISPNVQLDISASRGLNNPGYYLSSGLSLRGGFNRKPKSLVQ
jgi:hypothetical protein